MGFLRSVILSISENKGFQCKQNPREMLGVITEGRGWQASCLSSLLGSSGAHHCQEPMMSGSRTFLFSCSSVSQPQQQGGRVQASSLHSSFLQKQHADDSIWSCSNRRHKLVWEGEEKKGGVQEQGEKEGGGGAGGGPGRGGVTRVQMEGGAEYRLRMTLGGKEW